MCNALLHNSYGLLTYSTIFPFFYYFKIITTLVLFSLLYLVFVNLSLALYALKLYITLGPP